MNVEGVKLSTAGCLGAAAGKVLLGRQDQNAVSLVELN